MSDDFYKTRMGQRFFESTMPAIAEALQAIAKRLSTPQEPATANFEERLANLERHAAGILSGEKPFVEMVWVVTHGKPSKMSITGVFATAAAVRDALSPELSSQEWRETLNRWTGDKSVADLDGYAIHVETVQL